MRAAILTMAFLVCLVLPLRAADDIATAQATIRSQAEALGRDDGATAYSYAAPGIQQIFQQPDMFMAMVRQNYTPVYRHRRFEFGEARVADGKVAQKVHITDAEGELWEALYTLEPQPDGSLKIAGCVLAKATGA